MDLRQLEYIEAIAEEGNLSRAAERLFITQSALSQLLRKLRDEGLPPLFQERKHRMELTDAGRIYLNGARAILRLERMAREEMDHVQSGTRRRLRLGVSSNYVLPVYRYLLPVLKRYLPDADITISVPDAGAVRELLRSREIDAAIVPDIFLHADIFHYDELFRDELVMMVPEGAEPWSLPFVLPPKSSFLRQICEQAFSARGVYPEILTETSDWEVVRGLTGDGICMALVPRSLVRDPHVPVQSFEEPRYFSVSAMYLAEREADGLSVVAEIWRNEHSFL